MVVTGRAPGGPPEVLHTWASNGLLRIDGMTLLCESVDSLEIAAETALLECHVPGGKYPVTLGPAIGPPGGEAAARLACPDLPALSCRLPKLLRLRGGGSTSISVSGRDFSSPGDMDITGMGDVELRGKIELGGDLELFANPGADTGEARIRVGGHATLTGHRSVRVEPLHAGQAIGIGSADGPFSVAGAGAVLESGGSSITVAAAGPSIWMGPCGRKPTWIWSRGQACPEALPPPARPG